MAKEKITKAVTPSDTSKTEELLNDINVIVGKIATSEELCVSNLSTISESVEKKAIQSIVKCNEDIVRYTLTSANMLMTVAGYMLGNKAIKFEDTPASLLGNIPNAEPLFLGPKGEEASLFDILNAVLSEHQAPSVSVEQPSTKNSKLEVILSHGDGGNLDSLIEVVNKISELNTTGSINEIKKLSNLFSVINEIPSTVNISSKDIKRFDAVLTSIDKIKEIGINTSTLPSIDIEPLKNFAISISKADDKRIRTDLKRLVDTTNIISEQTNDFKVGFDTVYNNITGLDIDKFAQIGDVLTPEDIKPITDGLTRILELVNESKTTVKKISKGVAVLNESFLSIDIESIKKFSQGLSKSDAKNITGSINRLVNILNESSNLKVEKPIDKSVFENTKQLNDFIKELAPLYDTLANVKSVNHSKVIKSLTKNVKSLPKLLNAISSADFSSAGKHKVDDINAITDTIESIMYTLENIAKFAESDITDGLDDFKDEILPYLTSKKSIVSRLAKIDFSGFDSNYTENILQFESTVEALTLVLEELSKLSKYSAVIAACKNNLFESINAIDILIDGDKKCVGLINIIDSINEANTTTKSLDEFKNTLLSLTSVFGVMILAGMLGGFAAILAYPIQWGINGLNEVCLALQNNLQVSDIKDKQELIQTYRILMCDLAVLFLLIPFVGIFGLLSFVFLKPIEWSIKGLNSIAQIIVEKLNLPEMPDITKNLDAYTDIMIDLAIIFGVVTIVGILSIPALVGAFILSKTLNLIITLVSNSVESIKKLVSDTSSTEAIDAITRLIVTMGIVILVAALVGGFVGAHIVEVFTFLGVLCAFLFGVTTVIAIAGGIASLLKSSGGIESFAKIGDLIMICTGCMLIGALFMMIPGMSAKAVEFGITLAIFIALVLAPFALMSIFFKSALESADGIAKLIVCCTVVMLVGALFMMIPGLSAKSIEFGITLAIFIGLVLAPFLLFSLLGGKKAIKSINEIKNLIITCTIILVIGAFLMMIPEFADNALKFGLILGGFIFLVILPFGLFGKKIARASKSIWAIVALVVVSAMVISFGAAIIDTYGTDKPLTFALIVVGMITILSGVAYLLSKAKNIWTGVAAMAAIAIIAVGGAYALTVMGDAFQKFGDWTNALAMAAILTGTIVAFAVMANVLGGLSLNPFFWLGIAAIGVLVGIVYSISCAFKNIAEALVMMASIEGTEIDGPALTATIDAFIAIGKKLAKVADEIDTSALNAVAISMFLVGAMMSKIGTAVGDIANLKVATAWDSDGNAKEWRQLDKTDFKNAATNTEVIITTLGTAIMETYKRNPKMFEEPSAGGIAGFFGAKGKTPFDIVVRSCTGMGNMISTIGRAVGEISNLKLAIRWDKNGNPTKYENLPNTAFDDAATNTEKIITTLGYAIIDIYEKNPDMFVEPSAGGIVGFFGGKGKTPFDITVKACTGMGNMISTIGRAVGEISNLKVAIKWDKDGNPTKYEKLPNTAFDDAATNTNTIITTLGYAILDIYAKNPDIFVEPSAGGIAGFFGGKGKTPFDIVVRSCTGMGNMISTIGRAVADISNLKVAIKWDKNGNPTKYEKLPNTAFNDAATNIDTIITTLGKAINDIYEKNPKLFVEPSAGGIAGFFGAKGKTPFDIVVRSCTGMGNMISTIGRAVADVSNLKVAVKWDKNGNPTKYEKLPNTAFDDAATNIEKIITTLGYAIIGVYERNPAMFVEPSAGGIAGFFGGKGKTPFDITVKACTGMANMVSLIGKAVAEISNLTVGTKWDRDGNPIDYRTLDSGDFKKAAENTEEIITTLGNAIITTYEKNPDMFVEPSAGGLAGFFGGKKGKTPFDITVKACTGMGNMISLIGKSVAEISNLTVATKWDKDGNPVDYRDLKPADFKKAASNTDEIITTLGNAICKIYKENKELFEVPPVETSALGGLIKIKVPGKGKTAFEKVVQACSAMGGMISSIGNGVRDMADLRIATKWDKDGNAKEWRNLDKSDFETAGLRVGEIVTCIAKKLSDVYAADEVGIFKQGLTYKDGKLEGGDTPAMRVLTAASAVGDAMSSIANGVKDIAELRVEEYDDKGRPKGTFRPLKPKDFKKAALSVASVVLAIAKPLESVYNNNKSLFDEVVTYTTTSSGFLGMSKSTDKHVSDAPIVKVLSAAGNIGTFVGSCAEAVKAVADLRFTNTDGRSVIITEDMLKPYSGIVYKRVKAVVTCLGKALDGIYSDGEKTYFNPDWKVYEAVEESFASADSIVSGSLSTIDDINTALGEISNVDTINKKWQKIIDGIYAPVNSGTVTVEKTESINGFFRTSKSGIREVVTTINSLDTEKADKFIELSKELKDLSVKMGDMGGIIEALNGRINDTLNNVSTTLNDATKALAKSDEAYAKREKLIKKNTKELKRVLETPMRISVSNEGGVGGGSFFSGGSSSSTTTINNSTSSGGSSRGSSAQTDRYLSQIAGSIQDIITKLNNLLENQ